MVAERRRVNYWVDRFQAEGETCLHYRSSRSHSNSIQTAAELEQAVLELRARERRGREWNGPEPGRLGRTMPRILRHHKEPCLRDLDPMTGQLIRSAKTIAIRHDRKLWGELLHTDVKRDRPYPGWPRMARHWP